MVLLVSICLSTLKKIFNCPKTFFNTHLYIKNIGVSVHVLQGTWILFSDLFEQLTCSIKICNQQINNSQYIMCKIQFNIISSMTSQMACAFSLDSPYLSYNLLQFCYFGNSIRCIIRCSNYIFTQNYINPGQLNHCITIQWKARSPFQPFKLYFRGSFLILAYQILNLKKFEPEILKIKYVSKKSKE